MNTALADGRFLKGRKLIPTLQFRRKLAHEMTENTISVETMYYGRPGRSTRTSAIVIFKFKKVKNNEGGYDKKSKESKNPNRNIKNRDAPTLKPATNGL